MNGGQDSRGNGEGVGEDALSADFFGYTAGQKLARAGALDDQPDGLVPGEITPKQIRDATGRSGVAAGY